MINQLDNSRAFTKVFIKKFPFDTDDKIYCPNKNKDIQRVTDSRVKFQKFYAYKLLETVICQEFGVDKKDLVLTQQKTGKWTCDYCHFSISHSKDVVCVAISSHCVGVDIEEYNPQRFVAIRTKISNIETDGDVLNRLWTQKEAVYKCDGCLNYDGKDYHITSKKVVDGEFYLSVAQKEKIDVEIK